MIAGGGPAGAAAAIALARSGRRPLLLERSATGSDVVCGGFLGWDTLALLERLGIDAAVLGARPIHSLRIATPTRTGTMRLPAIAAGLSRRILDAALLAQAGQLGAAIERGVTVRALLPDRLAIRTADDAVITADSLLLATGKHELRGAARDVRHRALSLGLRRAFVPDRAVAEALSGYLELYIYEDGYAGLLLQEDGLANFCLSVSEARLRTLPRKPDALLAALARECPLMGERLAAMRGDGDWSAIAGVPYGWRTSATRARMMRLGDQVAVIPSIVGDGVAIALASGMAAARQPADAETCQATFARAVRRPILAAEAIRRIAARPMLANGLLRVMTGWPGLAGRIAHISRIEGY